MVNVKEKLSEGYFLVRMVFEVLGKPKEHVEETIGKLLEELKKTENLFIAKEDIFEVKEQEGGFFSSFSEIEFLVKDFNIVIFLCFTYMPSSVEILEPENMRLRNDFMSGVFNDLLGRLHQTDMVVKNLRAENHNIKITMGRLLRQVVVVLLETPMTEKEIADKLNIPQEQGKGILDTLLKEKLITKKGKVYARR